MRLTESLMVAFDKRLRMAERIADFIVGRHAAPNGWQIPEQFTNSWIVGRFYPGTQRLG
jgi:hypothetical protein